MTIRQKLDHLYTYYRKPAIPAIFMVVVVFTLAYTILHNKTTEEIFYCAIINNNMEREESVYLKDGFSSVYPSGPREYSTFDYGNFISYESGGSMESVAALQKLFSKSKAGELDCLITDSRFLDHYASGILTDLASFLPDELLSEVSTLLVYAPDEDGIPTAYGIDISKSHIITGADIYIEGPVLSISDTSIHREAVLAFLRYVLH